MISFNPFQSETLWDLSQIAFNTVLLFSLLYYGHLWSMMGFLYGLPFLQGKLDFSCQASSGFSAGSDLKRVDLSSGCNSVGGVLCWRWIIMIIMFSCRIRSLRFYPSWNIIYVYIINWYIDIIYIYILWYMIYAGSHSKSQFWELGSQILPKRPCIFSVEDGDISPVLNHLTPETTVADSVELDSLGFWIFLDVVCAFSSPVQSHFSHFLRHPILGFHLPIWFGQTSVMISFSFITHPQFCRLKFPCSLTNKLYFLINIPMCFWEKISI
jgi:hypothetical protein